MRILIVSEVYFPVISPRSFRTTELTEELLRRGHHVTVLLESTDSNYDYTSLYPQFFQHHLIEFVYFDKVREAITPHPIKQIFQKLGARAISPFIDFPDYKYKNRVYDYLKNHPAEYDLMISIAFPHPIHWGCAQWVHENPGKIKKWVADCGDPYMFNQVKKYPRRYEKEERNWCELADFITVPIENARKAYYPEYRDKIRVIPQGFNFDEFRDVSKSYTPSRTIRLAYAGVLYRGYRDMYPFVKYLAGLDVDFVFTLYTRSNKLVESYKELLRGRLVVKDFIPRKELIRELSQMDFLVNVENKGTVQAPSKLIDYALCHRPILSVGEIVNTQTVDEFMARDYTHQFTLPDLQAYNIVNVVDEFLRL